MLIDRYKYWIVGVYYLVFVVIFYATRTTYKRLKIKKNSIRKIRIHFINKKKKSF